jgi:hypothetical protein
MLWINIAALYCLATAINLLGIWFVNFFDDDANLPYFGAFIPVLNVLSAPIAILVLMISIPILPALLEDKKEETIKRRLRKTVLIARPFFRSLDKLSITNEYWHTVYFETLARDNFPEFKN